MGSCATGTRATAVRSALAPTARRSLAGPALGSPQAGRGPQPEHRDQSGGGGKAQAHLDGVVGEKAATGFEHRGERVDVGGGRAASR